VSSLILMASSASLQLGTRNVFSLAVSGGGASALTWLLTTPGASSALISADVPYSRGAMTHFLGAPLGGSQSCSKESAQEIASGDHTFAYSCSHIISLECTCIAVYHRTTSTLLAEDRRWSSLASGNVFGVACTAALVTIPPKRGAHRCFVGVTSRNGTKVFSLELDKGKRDRTGEDLVCSAVVVGAILDSISRLASNAEYFEEVRDKTATLAPILTAAETVSVEHVPTVDLLDALAARALATAFFIPVVGSVASPDFDQQFVSYSNIRLPPGTFIYSGSYNPLHGGHLQLAAAAIKASGVEADPLVLFELAAVNADKPPINATELRRRVSQFRSGHTAIEAVALHNYAVCVSNEPLFLGKARLFPGCNFIIGVDTLVRLLNPKYYNNSRAEMICMLSTVLGLGCSFYVGGRVGDTGFVTASSLLNANQEGLLDMFRPLSEEEFRVDLSSTQIRERDKATEII
jgi:nicotinic acid mononucleotide adenylyltransferase